MTRDGAHGWPWLGWLSLPLIGGASVIAGWALRERRGASVLLPDLSLGAAGDLPQPRSDLLVFAVAVTLGLALATLANLVLRAVGESRPGRRFVALWSAAGCAALLTSGAVALGSALAGGTPPSRAALFALVVEWVWASLRWALGWGLLAAAVTTWLAPRRPAADLGPVLHLRVAVASGLAFSTLLAGIGLGALTAAVFSPRSGPPAAMPRPAVAAPVPSVEPSDPPLPVNPVADRAFSGRCVESDVVVSYQGLDAAAGGRYASVAVLNRGHGTCVLNGFPDIAFADLLGDNIRVKLTHGGDWRGRRATPAPVRLDPGEVAHAELTWRADAGAEDREARTILVAAWAGAKRASFGGLFQVKNGTQVRVSPWLAKA
ncbi:DUF4232 domain-containing protein [Propionicimonas sp.]|uniref:DUF4232 domain-containing protein n=1 Tax=Propionicimonas sp. TaxID=1955623 RepID=UPI0039E3893D